MADRWIDSLVSRKMMNAKMQIVTNNEGGKLLRALEKLLAVGLGLCLPFSLWRTSGKNLLLDFFKKKVIPPLAFLKISIQDQGPLEMK